MSHLSCFLASCFAMNMLNFAGVWVPQPAIGCAGYLCSLVSWTCALLVVLFSCPRMHIYSVICWWPGRPLLKLNYTIPTLGWFSPFLDAFLFELWLCFPFLSFPLRFGWYGFNPGSTLTMKSGSDGALAAQVAMNTLAAATGGITVFLLRDWAAVRHVETRNWYTEWAIRHDNKMLVLHGFTMQNYDLRGKIGFECVEIAINGSQWDVFKDIINVHQIFCFSLMLPLLWSKKWTWGMFFHSI